MRETDRIDDILLHYGVKGMRWGVRKKVAEYAKASLKRDLNTYTKPISSTKAAISFIKKHKRPPILTKDIKEVNSETKRISEEKKAKRVSKKISQADKVWERTVEKGIMNKYANDNGVSMEARSKAEQQIKKMKTISRDQAQNIMTKAYADAINSRLKNDPQARNTTGNKQVRMEVVQQGRYIFMKPTIQELLKKPSKKRG